MSNNPRLKLCANRSIPGANIPFKVGIKYNYGANIPVSPPARPTISVNRCDVASYDNAESYSFSFDIYNNTGTNQIIGGGTVNTKLRPTQFYILKITGQSNWILYLDTDQGPLPIESDKGPCPDPFGNSNNKCQPYDETFQTTSSKCKKVSHKITICK